LALLVHFVDVRDRRDRERRALGVRPRVVVAEHQAVADVVRLETGRAVRDTVFPVERARVLCLFVVVREHRQAADVAFLVRHETRLPVVLVARVRRNVLRIRVRRVIRRAAAFAHASEFVEVDGVERDLRARDERRDDRVLTAAEDGRRTAETVRGQRERGDQIALRAVDADLVEGQFGDARVCAAEFVLHRLRRQELRHRHAFEVIERVHFRRVLGAGCAVIQRRAFADARRAVAVAVYLRLPGAAALLPAFGDQIAGDVERDGAGDVEPEVATADLGAAVRTLGNRRVFDHQHVFGLIHRTRGRGRIDVRT